MLIHASCVAIDGRAVLLAGSAGIGKSDVALRLIESGAQLVADDQTELQAVGNQIVASSPAAIAGLFEIRHVGLVRMPHTAAPVALYVELAGPEERLERLPEAEAIYLLDRPVCRLRLPAIAASTPAKIRAALLYPPATDA